MVLPLFTLLIVQQHLQLAKILIVDHFQPLLQINCELSAEDYTQLDFANANFFEISEDHDYYGRERSFRNGGGGDSCIDVTQECTPGTYN